MSNKPQHTLITDYLDLLGVPFTASYSEKQYDEMPFATLFGLKKLLETYGVKSEGYELSDKTEITRATPPFIASTRNGLVIVTDIGDEKITYMTQGVSETMPLADFIGVWPGKLLISRPDTDAAEPDYARHRNLDILVKSKKWVLAACVLWIFVYLGITNRIFYDVSTVLVAAVDIAGLYFTYLLVQKSLHFHNSAADRVCGVLQAGGCDSILEMSASKFFGLFGWSEVGFAYFSVSLAVLMLFPTMLPWLALCNVCCLPYTVWSIWYQRFRAHHWCTLCVCVQTSLWLLFFSYLSGGYIKYAWPIGLPFVTLVAAYGAVLFATNALSPYLDRGEKQ